MNRVPANRIPRVGFAGVGWIGRHRLEAIAESGVVEIAALADPAPGALAEAAARYPDARCYSEFHSLLEERLDGVVLATPSALHVDQAVAALDRGLAVFCQKPLGRNASEARRAVEAARKADRLLSVDLSYRHLAASTAVRPLVRGGELGRVYAADLVFHNAYGPDKDWFYKRALSGGGCVIDLGIHLVDLALWMLDFPSVENVTCRLHAGGRLLGPDAPEVEDHAAALIDVEGGTTLRLACSWRAPAGCDAVFEAAFYGTEGGAAVRNVNGSFYDFTAERFRGTARERLAEPPDAWGGRAAVDWARRMAARPRFDPEIENAITVAAVLDRMVGP